MISSHKVTIIVPVYGDWPSLKDCILSLNKYVDSRHKILLVNDCGPEVEKLEKNIKASIKDSSNFYYFRNPENLGFVKNCNRAVFELDKTSSDILLLNSDTVVTDGFLEEMLTVLHSSPKIGAVSPRSNNATIATVPLSAMAQKGIDHDKSYQQFRQLQKRLPRYNDVPTAHGFCILIRRTTINKYGLFDEAFGKGYGEEVDFCLRIRNHGYKSVLSNRAYVYHLEARSFNHEQKTELIKQSTKIILNRYPDYKNQITTYIQEALMREEGISPKVDTKARSMKNSAKKFLTKSPKLEKLTRKLYVSLKRQ